MGIEWKYIAALFDGEGGISLTVNGGFVPRLQIYICNTHKDMLESVQQELSCGTFGLADAKTKTWNLSFFSKDAQLLFLTGVQPWCRRRKQVIALAIEYVKLYPGKPGKQPVHKELLRWRLLEALREAIRAERADRRSE